MGFFFVKFAMMRYGIAQLAITPMRAEAADASEMINQVLFGEHFKVLEVRKKWSKIRLSHDKYEGWICNKQWQEIDKTTYTELDQQTPTLTTDLLDVVKDEQLLPIVIGSTLQLNRKEVQVQHSWQHNPLEQSVDPSLKKHHVLLVIRDLQLQWSHQHPSPDSSEPVQ